MGYFLQSLKEGDATAKDYIAYLEYFTGWTPSESLKRLSRKDKKTVEKYEKNGKIAI